MLTEKQFTDSFTAAGGWFILTQFETIINWKGNRQDLIDHLYSQGFDRARTGTTTRVNSVIRLIENGMGRKALEKIRYSKTINRQHPEAERLAEELILKYY